ncbi:MAG: hypothetical protein ACOX1R_03360 [Caldicoprobacterales bacterium]|jgi:hypothetical protein|nr:hypothetical protein [Clostridiales bacterium]
MKYFILTIAFWAFIYLLSFARYNWNKRNRMAAIGAIIIALAALAMPFILS